MTPWIPVGYYYCNRLGKTNIEKVLPHKPGFLPEYFKKSKGNGITQPKTNTITNGSSI
jgi:hypothetical protein